ncbi:MAG: hypothetical protein JST22_13950 [Bacteroidetes bacterium]|nr:hypothetical protein [Bacteroidota bacterium]
MNMRSRFLATVVVLATIISMAPAASRAAGVPWGGCPATTVCNLSGCNLRLVFGSFPGPVLFAVNVGPGACARVNTAGLATIDFVRSAGGNFYAVQAPPPAVPCNCPAGNWFVDCVTLVAGCCSDVCFDQANCQINILPAACPGPCRP